MYALLPSSVITPGYTGTPPLATSPGWGTRQPQGASSERRRVTIYRDSLDIPWGFRLQGGKDLNTPLSVKRVFSGSPADGQLTRDDLILAIDDQPVDDLSSAQVTETIKSAGASIVLTIETRPYDSAFDSNFNFEPVRKTVHQKPVSPVQQMQPTKHETKTSDYDSYQSSPYSSYETTPPDSKRPTSSAFYSKVTTPNKHRSANRFQANPALPYGACQPGWAPTSKPTGFSAPLETGTKLPTTTTKAETEQPVSQHRSARQQAKSPGSSGDAGWRSQYAVVEEPHVPVWYGSLRSTRAPHPWEVRAAKTQSPGYEDAQQQTVPSQTKVSQPEPTQTQQSRTYKAEIRGLMLARPSYLQSPSTPEWEGTSDRQAYRTSDQAHSAPGTPSADISGKTVYSDAQTVPPQIADHLQQADGSVPVKIQPSVLFSNRNVGKTVQLPAQAQARVPLRAQPQESRGTSQVGQPREEARVHETQFVSAPRVQQQAVSAPKVLGTPEVPTTTKIIPAHARVAERNVAAPTPVTVAKPTAEVAKAPQRVPTVQIKSAPPSRIIERFNPVPDRPERENQVRTQTAHLSSVIERFNPTPDRPQKLTQISAPGSLVKITQTAVEHFNPTPDKKEQIAKQPASHSQVNSSSRPVERFNPTPDREEKPKTPLVTPSPPKLPSTPVGSVSQQTARSTKSTVSPAPVKFSQSQIERFNPSPKFSETPIERFNPSPKFSQAQIERFNPSPNRLQDIVTAQKVHASKNFQSTPLERFNPTPDRPLTKVQHLKMERFNPVPDRP